MEFFGDGVAVIDSRDSAYEMRLKRRVVIPPFD